MISNFSSFVEFFAAIYVTMTVNNDFCSNFWTPKYYEEMKLLLSVYNFNGSSSIHDELLAHIKENYNVVQNNAHHRGFILLALCVCYLIFMGFENERNSMVVEHYMPIICCTLFVGIILVISNIALKKWRRVVLFVSLCIVMYVSLNVFACAKISKLPISHFLYEYKCHIMIGIIVLPVAYQIYVYWLYSSIYKGYLKDKVAIEYNRFSTSMTGIKNREKNKVDKVYLDIWTDTKFNSEGDTTLTPFYKELNNRLLVLASPTHWQLVSSWFCYQGRTFIHKRKLKSKNASDMTTNMVIQNQLEKYEIGNVDFQKEYEDYCAWKKKARKNTSLKAYCAANKLPAKEVIAWLRDNNKKNNNK